MFAYVVDGAVAPDDSVASAVRAEFMSVLEAADVWFAMLKSCCDILVPFHDCLQRTDAGRYVCCAGL